MSDGILNGLDPATLAVMFNDKEYTRTDAPLPVYEVAQLRARIAELEREQNALRLSLNTTNVIVNDQIGKIADLIKERDAAITDARELAGLAAYAYRVGAGVFFTSDEREKVKKYAGAGVFFTHYELEQVKKYLVAEK